MRQKGASEDDVNFRKALENMRYKACTHDDIRLLRSRILGTASDLPNLSDPNFKDISIITPRNAHRDIINQHGARRFAAEHQVRLEYFHSIDEWEAPRAGTRSKNTKTLAKLLRDPLRNGGDLDLNIREMLWNLPPSSTSHLPGMLPLCIGMPVILKANQATELCATNGAEATVYSWDYFTDHTGRKYLNTLFVSLKDPPRHVQVNGLPEDVIPVVRIRDRMPFTLLNDKLMFITREQVQVLPNFAMSDFTSQGRTRPYNPCHMTHCRSHQSIYTCLSRSSSLRGTLIIDGFDANKIIGGLTGDVRTEFQELDILDMITSLKYANKLPPQVRGTYRASLIKSWKSHGSSVSAACAENAHTIGPTAERAVGLDENRLRRKRPLSHDASDVSNKRPHIGRTDDALNLFAPTHTPSRGLDDSTVSIVVIPWALRSDQANASCAYDAILCALWFISNTLGDARCQVLCRANPFLIRVFEAFHHVRTGSMSMEPIRYILRSMLTASYPASFTCVGLQHTSLNDLIHVMFTSWCETPYGTISSRCLMCLGRPYDIELPIRECFWSTAPMYGQAERVYECDLQATLMSILNRKTYIPCPNGCGSRLSLVHMLSTAPQVVLLEFDIGVTGTNRVIINDSIRVPVGTGFVNYRLSIAFRYYNDHYSVIVLNALQGGVLYYDGLSRDGRCYEARVAGIEPYLSTGTICACIYLPSA